MSHVLSWSSVYPQPLLSKFLIPSSSLERSHASALVRLLFLDRHETAALRNLRYRALRARIENEEFRIEKVLGWSVGAPKPLLSKFLILNSKLERSRASALVPFLSHYVRHLSPFWGKRAANALINIGLLILEKPETTALRNLPYRFLFVDRHETTALRNLPYRATCFCLKGKTAPLAQECSLAPVGRKGKSAQSVGGVLLKVPEGRKGKSAQSVDSVLLKVADGRKGKSAQNTASLHLAGGIFTIERTIHLTSSSIPCMLCLVHIIWLELFSLCWPRHSIFTAAPTIRCTMCPTHRSRRKSLKKPILQRRRQSITSSTS